MLGLWLMDILLKIIHYSLKVYACKCNKCHGDEVQVAYSRVSLKVSVVDCLDELLCDLYDLLFSGCGDKTQRWGTGGHI